MPWGWSLSSLSIGGKEGYYGVQFLFLAEAYFDLAAPAQRLHPDRQFECLAHELRGFVELMRRRALIFGFHPALCPRAGEGFSRPRAHRPAPTSTRRVPGHAGRGDPGRA